MEIKHFDKEFIERTKNIVQTQCKEDFEYDVTLLLNCMLGLVSLPTERTKAGQSLFKQECVNKLKNMGVIINSTDDDKTFRTVKNALSPMNIAPQNMDGVIDSIIIKDRRESSAPVHTELRFTVTQLKEFALFVADKHLERYANKITSKKK
ncbi:HEPN family nuclease [Faecalimonas umbilicata]|uniref:HEPN family nuclease n=1 Tax=Faecalimonas umbilicata TaxID=1912855 RepID=UPI002A80E4F2|nr:HEPN family nuclease [Faecalimonas umbilicata]MDY4596088.1 HEPN family nuclease [Faecalimonas umbilicata]